MRCGLLVCVLCSWVVSTRARVLWWGEAPQADEAQTAEDDGTEVLRMVEALGRDLQDLAGQEDSWLTRYQQVAETMKENNEITEELVSTSNMVVPLLRNAHMGQMMMTVLTQIKKGGVASHNFSTTGTVPPPPPPKFLFVCPTELTVDRPFQVQAIVRTTTEANVGIRIHFEPEEGEELDFDNGDILIGAHIRWHFDYGNSREIAFNDRYNGVWSRPEVTVGGEQWPDFNVGEKFLFYISKLGPCMHANVVLGRDMHANTPLDRPPMTFCPKHPRTGDPRKLWLTVNEDKVGAGEVIVHWVTWFPYD